jgi:hypothetical protein
MVSNAGPCRDYGEDGKFMFIVRKNIHGGCDFFIKLIPFVINLTLNKYNPYEHIRGWGCVFAFRWIVWIKCNLSLAIYYEGTELGCHTDEAPIGFGTGQALHVVLVLKNATKGGEFICPKALFTSKNLNIFNGARNQHEVTRVKKGKRISLVNIICLGKRKEAY